MKIDKDSMSQSPKIVEELYSKNTDTHNDDTHCSLDVLENQTSNEENPALELKIDDVPPKDGSLSL
jgi:hypothetical protein